MDDDVALLREFAVNRSNEAFAALVHRHVGFVYSAALRQVGGTHRAEDVVQAVFSDLARKAGAVSRRTDIVGWLHTSTHFAAAKLKRTEQRRENRERAAHAMQSLDNDSISTDWEQIRPVLDDALQALSPRDRGAVLMRYFQSLPFSEIGRRLELGEDAARMRVDRAIHSLRSVLERRGVTSSASALAAALAHQPIVAAPAMLAGTASLNALVAASSTGLLSGTAASLVSLMSTTKTVIAVGGVLAIVATGTIVYDGAKSPRHPATANGDPTGVPPLPAFATERSEKSSVGAGQSGSGAASLLAAQRLEKDEQARVLAEKLLEKANALRAAKQAAKQAEDQARLGKQPTLSTTSYPATAEVSSITAIRTTEAAIAYFGLLEQQLLFPSLQYLYTLPAPSEKDMLVSALFEAWTSRDAIAAMAAAEKGGIPMECVALESWTRVNQSAAWDWVASSGPLRGQYMAALVAGSVRTGREGWLAERLTPLAAEAEVVSGLSPAIASLAGLWASREPSSASQWLKALDQVSPSTAANAGASVAGAIANLSNIEVVALVGGQSEMVGDSMMTALVKKWVETNQISRLGDDELKVLGMSQTRSNGVMATIAESIVADDPGYSIRLLKQVREPDFNLGMEMSFTLGKIPSIDPDRGPEAMQLAVGWPDQMPRREAVVQVYQQWRLKQPEKARAFIERVTFPAELRAMLTQSETAIPNTGSEQERAATEKERARAIMEAQLRANAMESR